MINRVVEQLGVLTHLQATGTMHVEAKPIALTADAQGKSLEQRVQSVADNATNMIVAELAREQEFLGREKKTDASPTK